MNRQLLILLACASLTSIGCSSTKKSSDNGTDIANNKNIPSVQQSTPASQQEAKPAKMEQQEVLYDK